MSKRTHHKVKWLYRLCWNIKCTKKCNQELNTIDGQCPNLCQKKDWSHPYYLVGLIFVVLSRYSIEIISRKQQKKRTCKMSEEWLKTSFSKNLGVFSKWFRSTEEVSPKFWQLCTKFSRPKVWNEALNLATMGLQPWPWPLSVGEWGIPEPIHLDHLGFDIACICILHIPWKSNHHFL